MIPKIIHYCWFGGNPLPESAKKCIESWKKCCPDYEIKEWNESNYDIQKNPYMKEAYEMEKWGFVPDYARLDIIYQYGGIYLDTDVELLKNMDPLLSEKAFMGCEGRTSASPGLGFGAEKGNPIIKEILENVYKNRHFLQADGSIDTTPSPRLNTEFLKTKGLKLSGEIEHLGDEITIYPAEYFAPKNFATGEIVLTDHTYSIHHYDASWYEPEDKVIMKVRWRCNKYGKPGHVVAFVIAKVLGVKRHLRMQGFMGTLAYIYKGIKGT